MVRQLKTPLRVESASGMTTVARSRARLFTGIMRIDRNFHTAYRELEGRMKVQAEADGAVFPNPQPLGPVQYVLICMEPSLGWWAPTAEVARSRLAAGLRNFLFSIEDHILQFCIRRYLCGVGERYHITDLSKGAMLVSGAGRDRIARYDRWYPLLEEEIDLCTTSGGRLIAVGKAVFDYLQPRVPRRPLSQIIHYSGQAAAARARGIVGHEDSFQVFKDSVSLEDVIATTRNVFNSTGMSPELRDGFLSRLMKSRLTDSRRKLIFNYKLAFESMKL
jgi:hypothetical protein